MNASWENRQWWVWGLGIVLMLGGYFAGVHWPSRFDTLLQPSIQQLRQLAVHTTAFHTVWMTVAVIFLHNLFAALVIMVVSGILTAGIYPAWAMWMNGLTMGYVVATGASQLQVAPWRVFVFGMLPHGMFELPAFVWCGVLGIHLGYVALNAVWHMLRQRLFPHVDHNKQTGVRNSPAPSFRAQFLKTLKILPYPVGLLMLAAAIEGTVTPHLILMGIPHGH